LRSARHLDERDPAVGPCNLKPAVLERGVGLASGTNEAKALPFSITASAASFSAFPPSMALRDA
jgi:hypothetical protein